MAVAYISEQYKQGIQSGMKKYEILRDLDIFVLDNSIRESTVGQVRGHTTADKWRIYDEVKKCGFTDTIVASFSQEDRVDDDFLEELVLNEVDKTGLYALSEITTRVTNGIPDTNQLPLGLRKLKRVGMRNVILEIDLGDSVYNFNIFPVNNICKLLHRLITWCHDNLHEDSKVLVNFRDMPDVMSTYPNRLFEVVDFLAQLPARLRLFGLLFEDARGFALPEECAMWSKFIRKQMNANDWNGHLLVHVHEKFGLCDATVLEVLMNGASGIWASVCHEGTAVGHAASIVTLTNLVRLGNKKVLQRYNCSYLRTAAIHVTRITTGIDPPLKHPIYGKRALDFVLDLRRDEFDLAEFFGERAPVRISSISSVKMIRKRLVDVFGPDRQFTLDVAENMKRIMIYDLRERRKEEYMSPHGLAVLFGRSGGILTQVMREILAADNKYTPHAQIIVKKVRRRWDACVQNSEISNCNLIPYETFYNHFMEPHFAYYRCLDTKKALQAIDLDNNGYVDWNKFQVYLTWALRQYPETGSIDDVMRIVFRKGLTPIVRDERLKLTAKGETCTSNKENRQVTKQSHKQLTTSSYSKPHALVRKSFLPEIVMRKKHQ